MPDKKTDFLSFFGPRFFGPVDMREANPTMVLTALQSESQAKGQQKGEVPNANVLLDLP